MIRISSRYVQHLILFRRLVLVMHLLCCGMVLGGAVETSPRHLSNPQWLQLPTDSLMKLGGYYLDKRNIPDSAYLCFSIIIDRYHENKLKKEELKFAVRTMHDMGLLHLRVYNDYMKAKTYLLMGQDLAIKCNDSTIVPSFSLSLANLLMANSVLSPENTDYKAIIEQYKRAFHDALKVKYWKALQLITLTVMNVAFGEDMLPMITEEMETYSKLEIPNTIIGLDYSKALCRGLLLWQQGQQEQAIEAFKSLHVSQDLPWYNLIEYKFLIHEILYHAFLKRKDHAATLAEIQAMENLAIHVKWPECLTDVYRYYYLYYQSLNNLALADKYELMWHRQRDQVIQQTHFNDMKDADFMMQMGKKDEQMRNIEHKRRVQQAILWATVATMLLILGLLWMLHRKYRQEKEQNQVLYHRMQESLAAEDALRQLRTQNAQNAVKPKYQHTQIDKDTRAELIERITQVLESSPEVYNDTFSLDRLSELVDAKHSNYVSQVINEHWGCNFPAMINECRVKEACRRMNDVEHYGNQTIKAIAQSVGFNSHSNFVNTFRKFTGLTPSAYLKLTRTNPKTES
ncbi:MAG: helix-turn-helix transcriptional regulator [Muribaculaceae bacterium]|nr:helix-turn-helix transcriptional regulator [Muribaculaceae bacterium]